MRVINIILVILFIFFIILNIYYSVKIRKSYLEGFEANTQNSDADQPIRFFNSYPNEEISYGSILPCTVNCKSTTDMLIANDKNGSFVNTYSKYHKNFKLENLYNSSKDYSTYSDVMELKPLLAYKCLKMSPEKIAEFSIKNNYPYILKNLYIHSEQMLIEYIKSEIDKVINYGSCNTFDITKTSTPDNIFCQTYLQLDKNANRGSNKIFGPVYVAISQAPFLRKNNELISARFEVTNNKRSYYNENLISGTNVIHKETGDKDGEFSSLYANITIVFPLYELTDADGKGITKIKLSTDADRINKFASNISSLAVNDELCHLKCNKMDLSCGCLNVTKTKIDKEFNAENSFSRPFVNPILNKKGIRTYDSVCLSFEDKPEDYSVMYFLNPYSTFKTVIANILRN